MPVLQIGKPYIAGRTSIAPGAEFNFRGASQHELLLCFANLAEDEIAAVHQGAAEFGLVVAGDVIFFLYRFGEAIGWSDTPYSYHLLPADQRQQLHETPATAETRALLRVVLVDADHNIVRALRAVTFSPQFTRRLHAAIAGQAAGPWNAEDFDAQLRSAYEHWPTTEQMLNRASARTYGGA
jgi:hypothetical protein